MLRGIFMPAGVTPDQVAFYVDLLKKVRATPEWKDFMEHGAFNQTFMTGADYVKWVAKNEADAPVADEGSRLPGQVVRPHDAPCADQPPRMRAAVVERSVDQRRRLLSMESKHRRPA